MLLGDDDFEVVGCTNLKFSSYLVGMRLQLFRYYAFTVANFYLHFSDRRNGYDNSEIWLCSVSERRGTGIYYKACESPLFLVLRKQYFFCHFPLSSLLFFNILMHFGMIFSISKVLKKLYNVILRHASNSLLRSSQHLGQAVMVL